MRDAGGGEVWVQGGRDVPGPSSGVAAMADTKESVSVSLGHKFLSWLPPNSVRAVGKRGLGGEGAGWGPSPQPSWS